MKRKRINLPWLLTLVVMALILFTPLGFHLKVWVNRLLSPDPKIIASSTFERPKIEDWKLHDLRGNSFHAENLKGQVVLINFWASWCPPCVAEMPSLEKLHMEFGDRASFLFVARDQKDKVISYLEKNNYNFPVYFESTLPPVELNNNALPTSYILDKTGKIVVAHTGAANWYAEDTRKLLDSLLMN